MQKIKSDTKVKFSARMLLFLSVTLIVFLTSCDESMIEPTAYGQTTTDNFWRNADDAQAAINAVYAPMTGFMGHTYHTLSNIPSDDEYRAGDHGDHEEIENFTYDASHAKFNSFWEGAYEVIKRSNDVLINVPDIEMEQNLKNRIMGEAYFIRGMVYWYFAKLFGGVPLILEEETKAGEFIKPRATLEETYAQAESDLQEAAQLLPDNHEGEDLGRPNRGSALGYLTKLYVYQKRWEDAISTGEEVVNGPWPLANSFQDNFKSETQYNPEILFTIGSKEGWNRSSHPQFTTPRPWGGWDFHAPLPDLLNEFENDDPRQDYSIMMPGDTFDLGGDRGPTVYTPDLSPTTGYHYQKWAEWRPSGGQNYDMNLPLLRSADVYLLVAEAKIRSGGNGDDELNAVRLRSGMPAITNATMDDIIHERRVELSGESQRHFDLMRWDRDGIVDIVEIYSEDRGQYDPSRNFVRPKHYYYAIPQRHIDLSNGVLEQNPGH